MDECTEHFLVLELELDALIIWRLLVLSNSELNLIREDCEVKTNDQVSVIVAERNGLY